MNGIGYDSKSVASTLRRTPTYWNGDCFLDGSEKSGAPADAPRIRLYLVQLL
jgi:hypothetical protein